MKNLISLYSLMVIFAGITASTLAFAGAESTGGPNSTEFAIGADASGGLPLPHYICTGKQGDDGSNFVITVGPTSDLKKVVLTITEYGIRANRSLPIDVDVMIFGSPNSVRYYAASVDLRIQVNNTPSFPGIVSARFYEKTLTDVPLSCGYLN